MVHRWICPFWVPTLCFISASSQENQNHSPMNVIPTFSLSLFVSLAPARSHSRPLLCRENNWKQFTELLCALQSAYAHTETFIYFLFHFWSRYTITQKICGTLYSIRAWAYNYAHIILNNDDVDAVLFRSETITIAHNQLKGKSKHWIP